MNELKNKLLNSTIEETCKIIKELRETMTIEEIEKLVFDN